MDPDPEDVVPTRRIEPPAGRAAGGAEGFYRDALREVGEIVSARGSIEELFQRVLELTIRLTGAERGYVYLVEEGKVVLASSRRETGERVPRPQDEISRTIVSQALEEGRTIHLSDAAAETRATSVVRRGVRSVLCVPLKSMGRTVGGLYLEDRRRRARFGENEIGAIGRFAEQVGIAIESARRVEELTRESHGMRATILRMQESLEERFGHEGLVGKSARMQQVYRTLDRLAGSNVPVVIRGESGTGKEMVARALHFGGRRRQGPFEATNCAAFNAGTLGSELFGHVRGAFTGAIEDRKGLFELASGGTLFLDEVAEIPLALQAQLLRSLQEGEVRPVGSDKTVRVDVRVVAAASADLARRVADGRLREDLYFRLRGVEIELPPLRERLEDLPLLVVHFMSRFDTAGRREPRKIAPDALRALAEHDWPGNVRELENVLRSAIALHPDGAIDRHVLHASISRNPAPRDPCESPFLGKTLAQMEREAIVAALAAYKQRKGRQNKSEVAKALGINRNTLEAKIKRYRIET
ncbi:MAG: sigma-54-dependent Fis family transcriptional regulator [Planctomycetes bacterium]|nr:sigma-54-dependent Fis family transcriptional regulator [Planctomycetota bacterium]